MAAKPIAVLYIPADVWEKEINYRHGTFIRNFNIDFSDYYWFVWPDFDAKRPELKVYYEKDFTQIQYDELLKQVNEKIEEIKNKNTTHD